MKKQRLMKTTALVLATVVSLSGCKSFISEDVASYPLQSALTSAELVDYYAKSLSYDTQVTRTVTKHETTYELKEVTGDKKTKLEALTKSCEEILGLQEYIPTEDSLKLVSLDTYNYIKTTLDNEVLTDSRISNVQGALGYYFVDVDYNIRAKSPGTFTALANLVGIDGVFYVDATGNYCINKAFLRVLAEKLNEYYLENNIMKCAVIPENILSYFDNSNDSHFLARLSLIADENDGTEALIKVLNDTAPVVNKQTIETVKPNVEETTPDEEAEGETGETDNTSGSSGLGDLLTGGNDTNTGNNTDNSTDNNDNSTDNNDSNIGNDNQTDSGQDTPDEDASGSQLDLSGVEFGKEDSYTVMTAPDRMKQIDIELINEIVGSSLSQISMMPSLEYIYNIAESEGVISGYGIFPCGQAGLRTFDFIRDDIGGNITLRYVFKDDTKGTGNIYGSNVYIVEESMTTGINKTDNNVLLPDFLKSELEQVIERADRVYINNDLAGYMSGNLYEDMGTGILRGVKDTCSNTLRYMSTIRQIISRNTANNSYLLEVETTTTEGAKDVDCYGTYTDIYYVVVQQQEDEFIINDWIRVSRTLIREPDINPNSNIQKRLIALNLAGSIEDDAKSSIKVLLGKLYNAGTYRVLTGPKQLTINGQTIDIDKGMYDCFSSDTSVLSSDELEYENSSLRNVLIRYGSDISAVYSGTVTEWIGGYEKQAEFTTEELVTYRGIDRGYYMQVYYLVSIENDEWVIDERTVLDEYEVKEAETLKNIQVRVGQREAE